MTSRAAIEAFLRSAHLALVGASRSKGKFGNAVLKELRSQGYRISLVHPEADEIEGLPCHRRVADLPDDVEGLVLVVPPEQSVRLVEEAADAGIGRVWMQQGAQSEEAVRRARERGLEVVAGRCILMYARPTGIHRLHHWLQGVFGGHPD